MALNSKPLSFLTSAETVYVAYSGGLDSSVLLHALAQLRQEKKFTLKALHIHHGLHAQADAWQTHNELICQAWDIELIVYKLDLSASSKNIEERAREQRYDVFASFLQENDVICTAHHQDDQAETVLLQLIRGAGPKGLSAMPEESMLGRGRLLRPFLHISRAELLEYATTHQLSWVEDDSNKNTQFSRNFIRHELFPLLKTRWPSVAETMSRSAKHCAETEKLLTEYAELLLSQSSSLKISFLKTLTFLQQKLVIRHWLAKQNFLLPNEVKLENLLHSFLNAAEDKNPVMTWDNVEIRRYRDELFAMQKLLPHDVNQVLKWVDLAIPLVIQSLHIILSANKKIGDGVKILAQQCCEIRFHQPRLKKRFQALAIPPWQRDRVPLLYVENTLAAIVGYEICKEFRVEKDQVGFVIEIK